MKKILTRDLLIEAKRTAADVPADGIFRKAVTADAVETTGDRTVRFTISTGSVDRDNDTVAPAGWDLSDYKKNPVVLWAHDYSQLPVGKAVEVGVVNGKLAATMEFADHDFANTVCRMVKGGFLRATSVGFRPKAYELNIERGGMDFKQQELLEFSIVPVPANADALVEARAAGIDIEPLKKWAAETLALAKAAGDDMVTCAVCNNQIPKDVECAYCAKAGKAAAPVATKDGITEEQAEAVRYAALASMLSQVGNLLASANNAVDALNSDQMMDDEVERAHLSVLGAIASQMNGVLWGVQDLARSACEADDGEPKIIVQLAAADTAALIKRGRVISAANEGRLRQAREHLDAVIKTVEATPQVDDQTMAPVIETTTTKEAEIDLDAIKAADDLDDVLGGITADDVREALRASVGAALKDVVQTETRSAFLRATGRVD